MPSPDSVIDSPIERARARLDGLDLSAAARAAVVAALGEPAEREAPTRDRVYLSRVSVKGFRGIGPQVDLELDPRPGLTVVVGRNGSGKSSLAEALELMLTDSNHRWADRPKVWREGWRNLHDGTGARIAATFALEGEERTIVAERRWDDAATRVDDATLAVHGLDGSTTSLAALGWSGPLAQMRPFLPYSELGTMFDKPLTIYDTLASILGLDDIEAAWSGLRRMRLDAEKEERRLRTERSDLAAAAGELTDDPRAAGLAALLATRSNDLAAIEEALSGRAADDAPRAAALRRLAGTTLAEPAAVDPALAARTAARAAADQVATTDAAEQRRLADLVAAAVVHRAASLDQDCPVCGTEGVLDEDWVREAEERVRALRRRAGALDEAERALTAADGAVDALVAPARQVLADARQAGLDTEALHAAGEAWAERGDADALRALLAAAAALVAAADAASDEGDMAWRALVRRVDPWLAAARERASGTPAAVMKEAEAALATVIAGLRAERLAPIADGARRTWQALSRQSNVTFHDIGLTRSGDARAARIDVRVDGSDTAALAVLSQGELNALALSVFLPRATLDASPFRFAVIDDPVQAMDPAKVDGLARVLHAHGVDRQIVVFTHDARLPDALVRLGLDAQVVDVQRDLRSQIRLRPGRDVIRRYCEDAKACVRDEGLSWEVRARLATGLCRNAVEAGAARAIWRRRLRRGIPHARIEAELERCRTTNELIVAVFREDGAEPNPMASIRRAFGPEACDALRDIRDGAHGTVRDDLDLPPLVNRTQALALGLAALPA